MAAKWPRSQVLGETRLEILGPLGPLAANRPSARTLEVRAQSAIVSLIRGASAGGMPKMSAAIVLIHGRGPKPRKDLLLECWKEFLPPATAALPIDMVHWVDLFGYNPPVTPDDQHDCQLN